MTARYKKASAARRGTDAGESRFRKEPIQERAEGRAFGFLRSLKEKKRSAAEAAIRSRAAGTIASVLTVV